MDLKYIARIKIIFFKTLLFTVKKLSIDIYHKIISLIVSQNIFLTYIIMKIFTNFDTNLDIKVFNKAIDEF